jgi:peptide/nickel transport system permease protein
MAEIGTYQSDAALDVLDSQWAEPSLTAQAWARFLRHRLALAGAIIFLFMIIAVSLGPLIYRVPINHIDFSQTLKGPSFAHPMGTDDLGQDLLARILSGGRLSLAVGVTAMLIAVVLGTVIGAIAGYAGGIVDGALMRFTDLFFALPELPLLLLLIYLFRDSLRQALGPQTGIFILVVVVIGGLRWMTVARLVRASFLALRERDFLVAARAMGVSPARQILTHLLPNSLGPIMVAATLEVGIAIISESSLSFLGLGFPPDIPTWGRLLFDAQEHLDTGPHFAIFPGLMIFLAVLSINYVGDGLRDALDPRRLL